MKPIINEKNLKKLANYLLALPSDYSHFDMKYYFLDENRCLQTIASNVPRSFEETPCGTVACAVGHGPEAGIEPLQFESWSEYISRNFINERPDDITLTREYMWCFSPRWKSIDNTPHGAAKRIYLMLKKGGASTFPMITSLMSTKDYIDVYKQFMNSHGYEVNV